MNTLRNKLVGRQRNRGAAAVELALLALPLMVMVLVAFEFARAMYQYNVLVQATRDAARLLTGFKAGSADYPVDAATNRVLYGPLGNTPLVPGITAAMVQICDQTAKPAPCPDINYLAYDTGAGTVSLVRVQVVNYQFKPMIGNLGILGGSTGITFAPIGTTMRAVY